MSVLALLLLVPLSQSSSGAPTCDLFGFRMATIPDLNGDRQPDILVADPWDGDLATCRGRVWAISGTGPPPVQWTRGLVTAAVEVQLAGASRGWGLGKGSPSPV